jgi:hypothetical protein
MWRTIKLLQRVCEAYLIENYKQEVKQRTNETSRKQSTKIDYERSSAKGGDATIYLKNMEHTALPGIRGEDTVGARLRSTS